jgi:hypothetical protein
VCALSSDVYASIIGNNDQEVYRGIVEDSLLKESLEPGSFGVLQYPAERKILTCCFKVGSNDEDKRSVFRESS